MNTEIATALVSAPKAVRTPEEKQADLDMALERLHKGVESLRSSSGWQSWLYFASRMPNYSMNNQLLILVQHPDASMVASFGTWKSMGRHVRRGETGLRILAPNTRRSAPADPDISFTGEESQGDRSTTPARFVTGYRMVSVFDVSQTEGLPLPEPERAVLLDGQAPEGVWESLAQQVSDAGFVLSRVTDAACIAGANGVTDFGAHTVKVRSDISDAQAVKTLAHELGHVLLHDPAVDPAWQVPCRGAKEVEAESVAYVVTGHCGMDSSSYTFAYVAGWADQAPSDVLMATAQRVRTAARTVIDALPVHALPHSATRVTVGLESPAPTSSMLFPARDSVGCSF